MLAVSFTAYRRNDDRFMIAVNAEHDVAILLQSGRRIVSCAAVIVSVYNK